MTETIDPMDSSRIDTQQFAQASAEQARSEGIELIGPGGLLTGLTKTVLRPLWRGTPTTWATTSTTRPAATGRTRATARGPKRCSLKIRLVVIEVPRDRDGTFEPLIVKKRQRRLDGIDNIVMSLTARAKVSGGGRNVSIMTEDFALDDIVPGLGT